MGYANNPDNRTTTATIIAQKFSGSTPILTEQGRRPIEVCKSASGLVTRSEVTFEDSLKPITELFSRQSEAIGYSKRKPVNSSGHFGAPENLATRSGAGWRPKEP